MFKDWQVPSETTALMAKLYTLMYLSTKDKRCTETSKQDNSTALLLPMLQLVGWTSPKSMLWSKPNPQTMSNLTSIVQEEQQEKEETASV